jgi:hypothetical protein
VYVLAVCVLRMCIYTCSYTLYLARKCAEFQRFPHVAITNGKFLSKHINMSVK